jgi:hypothetical protein
VKVSVGRGCRLLPSCRRPRGSGPGWGLPPGKQEMGPPALGALAFGFCCPCRAFCLLDQALCSGPASPFPDLMSLLFTVSFRAFSVSTSTACDNEAGLCCLGLGSLLVSVPCQNHQPIFSVSILPLSIATHPLAYPLPGHHTPFLAGQSQGLVYGVSAGPSRGSQIWVGPGLTWGMLVGRDRVALMAAPTGCSPGNQPLPAGAHHHCVHRAQCL